MHLLRFNAKALAEILSPPLVQESQSNYSDFSSKEQSDEINMYEEENSSFEQSFFKCINSSNVNFTL